MNHENSSSFDEIDRQILRLLSENARLTFKQLGEAVHLSSTSAAERVRRLEDAGVIAGYRAVLSPEKFGRPLQVHLRLRTTSDHYPRVLALLESLPEILECHHVTGDDSFLIKAAPRSMEDLEKLISIISPFGETSTALVLSSPISRPFQL